MTLSPLTAVSPVDGRYARHTEALRAHFSEQALMQARVRVEVAWLKALAGEPAITEVPALSPDAAAFLDRIANEFGTPDAERVKAIEATTNHDVKAIEYQGPARLPAAGNRCCEEDRSVFPQTERPGLGENLAHSTGLQAGQVT